VRDNFLQEKEVFENLVKGYIRDLLSWKRYVLKYHIAGVWDSLVAQAESITDANLVLLRLYADEDSNDLRGKAKEIGLPEIYGFDTRVLKVVRCPYIEEIKKALGEKKSFNYHWKDYSVKGYQEDDEFKAWFIPRRIVHKYAYYYLLDGEHALWALWALWKEG